MHPDLGSKMTGDGRLRFTVLGSFRVDRDGQEIGIGPRLQRALLAILVLDARHVVPVDRLIDLLWRDEPPAAAIASVQAYISHLRRVLVTEDPGYVLRVGNDQVDARDGDRRRVGSILHLIAGALADARPAAAAVIQGAADAHVATTARLAQSISSAASAALGDERARELRARGADMDWDQAIAYALTQTTQALDEPGPETQP